MEHDELTGWEEHRDFEIASEDMELHAMRREAEEAMQAEARIYEMELAERQAEWEAQQADPLRATCYQPIWNHDLDCQIGYHDNCLF